VAGYAFCPYDAHPLEGAPGETRYSSRPPPPRSGLPKTIGRFPVLGLLGKGSMGRVFHALHPELDREVAIKVLDVAQARTPEGVERFLREIKSLRAIRHPNVVQVYEAALGRDGSPFLVMEHLQGETLSAFLRRTPDLSHDFALHVALEVARGLNAAHAAGMIHRDVKPGNVFLVGPVGAPVGVKILDFGIARVSGAGPLTARGIILGTCEYMAPEQTVGDPVGRRADIYALGVVLYRMLTGKLPFAGEPGSVLALQLTRRPHPPRALNPDIAPAVERIVLNAMRKVPANRYSDMEDLIMDLERVTHQRAGEVTSEFLAFDDVYQAQTSFAQSMYALLHKKAEGL
jgi:eukaryotic-like serine/threonine-protein kinase